MKTTHAIAKISGKEYLCQIKMGDEGESSIKYLGSDEEKQKETKLFVSDEEIMENIIYNENVMCGFVAGIELGVGEDLIECTSDEEEAYVGTYSPQTHVDAEIAASILEKRGAILLTYGVDAEQDLDFFTENFIKQDNVLLPGQPNRSKIEVLRGGLYVKDNTYVAVMPLFDKDKVVFSDLCSYAGVLDYVNENFDSYEEIKEWNAHIDTSVTKSQIYLFGKWAISLVYGLGASAEVAIATKEYKYWKYTVRGLGNNDEIKGLEPMVDALKRLSNNSSKLQSLIKKGKGKEAVAFLHEEVMIPFAVDVNASFMAMDMFGEELEEEDKLEIASGDIDTLRRLTESMGPINGYAHAAQHKHPYIITTELAKAIMAQELPDINPKFYLLSSKKEFEEAKGDLRKAFGMPSGMDVPLSPDSTGTYLPLPDGSEFFMVNEANVKGFVYTTDLFKTIGTYYYSHSKRFDKVEGFFKKFLGTKKLDVKKAQAEFAETEHVRFEQFGLAFIAMVGDKYQENLLKRLLIATYPDAHEGYRNTIENKLINSSKDKSLESIEEVVAEVFSEK